MDVEGMSQDPVQLYVHLMELVDYFDTSSALKFFKSEEARAQNSKARALVGNGAEWAAELSEHQLAKLLFAAIALGG